MFRLLKIALLAVPIASLSLAQKVVDDPGVLVSAGANLTYRTGLRYSDRAASGTVIVDLTLKSDGAVSDARVVSGPDGLREYVEWNVRAWRYKPGTPGVRVTVDFHIDPITIGGNAGPIRIGGSVLGPQPKSKVDPEYPAEAIAQRIQGTVQLSFTITVDGTVKDVHVTSGHPLLTFAAVEAVKYWIYPPTLLNNIPVEVQTATSLSFVLPELPAK